MMGPCCRRCALKAGGCAGHAILNLEPSVGFASELELRGVPLQPGEGRAFSGAEVHETDWCNNHRWARNLYTCRKL